jgi:hypothetical protein
MPSAYSRTLSKNSPEIEQQVKIIEKLHNTPRHTKFGGLKKGLSLGQTFVNKS